MAYGKVIRQSHKSSFSNFTIWSLSTTQQDSFGETIGSRNSAQFIMLIVGTEGLLRRLQMTFLDIIFIKSRTFMIARNNTLTWLSFHTFKLAKKICRLKHQIQPFLIMFNSQETVKEVQGLDLNLAQCFHRIPHQVQNEFPDVWSELEVLNGQAALSRTSSNVFAGNTFLQFTELYRDILSLAHTVLQESQKEWKKMREDDSGKMSERCRQVGLLVVSRLQKLLYVDGLKQEALKHVREQLDEVRPMILTKFQKKQPFRVLINKKLVCLSMLINRLSNLSRIVEELSATQESIISDDVQQEIMRNIQKKVSERALVGMAREKLTEMRKSMAAICLCCQHKIATFDILKHTKYCLEYFSAYNKIQMLDEQILANEQDLRGAQAEIRAEKERADKMRAKSKLSINSKFKQTFIKSCISGGRVSMKEDLFEGSPKKKSLRFMDDNDVQMLDIKTCDDEQFENYMETINSFLKIASIIKQRRECTDTKIIKSMRNGNIEQKLSFNHPEVQTMRELLIQRKNQTIRLQKVQSRSKDSSMPKSYDDTASISEYSITELGYKSCEDESVNSQLAPMNKTGLSSFSEIGLIGKGRFGTVTLVRKNSTGKLYAMKKVPLENAKKYSEADIFKVINSEYLVRALFSFTQNGYYYYVMEYMRNGNLKELMDELTSMGQERLLEDQAQQYLAEIAMAINELHKEGIVHRDIKLENIVIDEKGHVKLTDYGLSLVEQVKQQKIVEEEEKYVSQFVRKLKSHKLVMSSKVDLQKKKKQIVGSPYFMSPEALKGETVTFMSDWWSFGVLTFLLLTGDVPFGGDVSKGYGELIQKIEEGRIWPTGFTFGVGGALSEASKSLIDGLLTVDMNKRLGNNFEQLKQHPFFQGIKWDLLLQTQPFFTFAENDLTFDDRQPQQSTQDGSSSVQSSNLSRRQDLLIQQTKQQNVGIQNPHITKYRKLQQFVAQYEHTN